MTKRIDCETLNLLDSWTANFSQNICKELVHKSFNSEVFLTDSHKISNNLFLVSAFLPKTHIYYNDTPDNLTHKHDAFLLLEVFRQTSIYTAHKFYNVSIDSKFIFESAAKYQDVKVILDSKYCIRKPSNQIGGASVLPTLTPDELLLNLDNDEHKRLKHFAMKEYSHTTLIFLESDIKKIITKNMQPYLIKKHFDLFKVLDDSILEINAKLLGINPKLYKDFLKPLSKSVQIANPNDTNSLIQDFMQIYNFILERIQDTSLVESNGIINKWVKNKNNATPPLNDKEICALLLGSVLGGYQNMLTIISKMIYALLFFPQLWDLLLKDKSILNNMINELLRLTNLGTTSTFPRITIADIRLSSFTIPKGSVVYANVFLANRDALIFENPLQINPFRKDKQHLQFGRGIHKLHGTTFCQT